MTLSNSTDVIVVDMSKEYTLIGGLSPLGLQPALVELGRQAAQAPAGRLPKRGYCLFVAGQEEPPGRRIGTLGEVGRWELRAVVEATCSSRPPRSSSRPPARR